MPLPPFATPADLSARRPAGVSEAETPRAWAALVDASALIRTETAPKTWVGDDNKLVDDMPEILTTVACTVAKRVIDNPEGVSSETLGAHAASYVDASSNVYLTKAELRAVRKAAGMTGLSTITTTRDPDSRGTETASALPYGPGVGEFLPTPDGDPIIWSGEVPA